MTNEAKSSESQQQGNLRPYIMYKIPFYTSKDDQCQRNFPIRCNGGRLEGNLAGEVLPQGI